MKPKTIRYDELKAGDVFEQYEKRRRARRRVCDADIEFEAAREVTLIGHAKRVEIPGLSEQHPCWLFRRQLYVGCQVFSAVKAFKALAKALGYEVTG